MARRRIDRGRQRPSNGAVVLGCLADLPASVSSPAQAAAVAGSSRLVEVAVAAGRTDTVLRRTPVPVRVIDDGEIARMGSCPPARSDDALLHRGSNAPVGDRPGPARQDLLRSVGTLRRDAVTGGRRVGTTRQKASNECWRTDDAQARTALVCSAPDPSARTSGALSRVGVDHQRTTDHLVRASVVHGAKLGGCSRAAESAVSASAATRPEKVTACEAASRSRHLGGRVSMRIAMLCNDCRDGLVALSGSVVHAVLVTDPCWSMASLRSRFEQSANPSGAAGTDFAGHERPPAPKFTLGTSPGRVPPVGVGGEAAFDTSVRCLAGQSADAANAAVLQLPGQTDIDLGASCLTAGRRRSSAVRVRNLADGPHALLRNRIPPLGVDATDCKPPRTVLATARHGL